MNKLKEWSPKDLGKFNQFCENMRATKVQIIR